ncbi:hypothetical protein EJF36_17325 [Bacillus sp. HMF5848]|uniref:hypothetical protein n=1 Tax=Bacillus sp. HMF5848 TaxID=2495421 RepID=UPI000F78181A|nr:hypothetical protein [Bacillus sp. HMF5848]RSK28487.1 hypothetical protein EJF36_17325 [Bacillus sp. HMF5848]
MKKKGFINKKSIPFVILAATHFLLLFLTMKERRKKYKWTLLMTNIGLAYLFEYVVLNIFKAYTYKPSILKIRAFDNILGSVLSQALFVPITSTYLTITHKNPAWKFVFASLYFFIEKLFIILHLYKVHWWRPTYTFILMLCYFQLSDVLYKAVKDRKRWVLKVAHYLSIEVVGVTLLFITAVRRKIRFGLGRFHSWREHFIIAPLYTLFLSFLSVVLSSRPGYMNRLLLLCSSICTDLLLISSGVLKINFKQALKNIPYHLFMVFISRLFYIQINKK